MTALEKRLRALYAEAFGAAHPGEPHLIGVISEAARLGAEVEREQVVAWLQNDAGEGHDGRGWAEIFAHEVAAGAHRPKAGGG